MLRRKLIIAAGGAGGGATLAFLGRALLINRKHLPAPADSYGAPLLLLASTQDDAVTNGFEWHNEDKNLSLEQIRKSVGKTKSDLSRDSTDRALYGSAFLLDTYGTLAMCAHELSKGNTSISFYPEKSVVCKSDVTILAVDKDSDVAFGALKNPSIIKKYGLEPIRWGSLDYDTLASNNPAAAVGFAKGKLLHATYVKIDDYVDQIGILADGKAGVINCKLSATAVAFPGMSGCGVFHNGLLVGMINTAYPNASNMKKFALIGDHVGSYFTPVETIRDDYVRLFPAYAKKSKLTAPDERKMPEACRFNRRQFLRLSR